MEEYKLSKDVVKALEKATNDLMDICQVNNIPMFLSVAVENTETNTKYLNTVYGTSSHNIELSDDQIKKHILISNGFVAVPKRDSNELDVSKIQELMD